MKDLIEEAERCDLEPKLASLWWTSTDDDERMDDSKIRKTTGLHKLPFEKKKKILGYTFQPARKDAGQIGGKVAERRQGLVERRESLKKHRGTMESGEWNTSTLYSVSGTKTGPGVERSWTELKVGRSCGVCSDSLKKG